MSRAEPQAAKPLLRLLRQKASVTSNGRRFVTHFAKCVTFESTIPRAGRRAFSLGREKRENGQAALPWICRTARTSTGRPHHEIYLSDPRRVPPERPRPLRRQPVAKSAA